MLLPSITLIVGLACLVWSANLFVSGSASAARHMGMSPVMIGLTIVALGTSAPEIIVSADAAWNDAPDLGIGNAIGSNIANIGLVLGATALFTTIPVASSLLRRELPVLLLVTAAAGACLWDHHVSFIEGVILLSSTGLVLGTLIWGAWKSYRRPSEPDSKPAADHCNPDIDLDELAADIPELPVVKTWILLVAGLLFLLASADVLVWSATELAHYFGVSPLIIGLTVVALGTSLPELAASIASALKGHHDIAVGNIMGSNVLNILAVMSIPALIDPPQLSAHVLHRDYGTMLALTLLLAAIIVRHAILRDRHLQQGVAEHECGGISKRWGALLLACYVAYYLAIFATAK